MYQDLATYGYVNLQDLHGDMEQNSTINTIDMYFFRCRYND